MKLSWNWVKRRWVEFRFGHSTYLSFVLSITNFLLITYTFLVERVPVLNTLFPHLWMFAAVGLIAYVPLSVLVGFWHRKKQLSVDGALNAEVNPYTLEILRRLEKLEKMLENMEEGKT